MEFDKQDQVDQVAPWVLASETLHAVFDCKGVGTGFIAITDKRLIFYDKAFMRKKKALTSIPFAKITAVSTVDTGRGFLQTAMAENSELVIKTGSDEFEFEFRGSKGLRAYSLIMSEILQHEPS